MGVVAAMILALLGVQGVGGQGRPDPDLPVIDIIDAPDRLRVGTAGELRLTYQARRANVVAVVQLIEDLDGPLVGRSTLQREVGVVARAFGRESGELRLPLSFRTPGRKRVALTLVTDEREMSESVVVYVEAVP